MNSNDGLIQISDHEFNTISSFVYGRFGINLTDQKRVLVQGRLQSLIRQLGVKNFTQYLQYLKNDRTEKALVELVDRISTNFTYFFREHEHFELFSKRVLPEITGILKRQNDRDLRVWSAGCSSGEEPYSLVILMMEFFGRDYISWDAGVLATDVSDKVIKIGKRGIYSGEQLKKVPADYRSQYFSAQSDGKFAVNDRVRAEVTFRHLNLINAQLPFRKPFHVIFCRNVMIYFDRQTRSNLVKRFYQLTVPGGYLFIGHSESLDRETSMYEYVSPSVYRKKE